MRSKLDSKYIHGNPWRPLISGTCLLAAIFITVSLTTNTWAIKQYNISGKSLLDSNRRITKLKFILGLWKECKEVTWLKVNAGGNDAQQDGGSPATTNQEVGTTVSCNTPNKVPG